ncbi:hypothetical protein [Roseovarius salinarum]|uniref:hypothetical protein n=1 Tax=Roseovarius salinarum TaxID=1981892 RepID=UPI000C346AF7|nr:hypothetical protein [Roseovarius salinarum]
MRPDMKLRFVQHRWQADLDHYFASRGQGVNAYLLRRQRGAEVARLNAMTDSELAQMGLTRAGIPAFVFDDLLDP